MQLLNVRSGRLTRCFSRRLETTRHFAVRFWAFSRRALYGTRRVAISTLVVLGMATVSPFIVFGGVLLVMAALGISAGVLALVEMWLPNNALERTGEQGGSC
jgi:hypothetical protein